jgi:exodeoxyribonuclease VII large subunit
LTRVHSGALRIWGAGAGLETLARALEREGAHALALRRERLAAGAARLDALSPLAVLGRGYAIASDAAGRVLRSAREVAVGAQVTVRLHEGELDATVRGIRERRSTP